MYGPNLIIPPILLGLRSDARLKQEMKEEKVDEEAGGSREGKEI